MAQPRKKKGAPKRKKGKKRAPRRAPEKVVRKPAPKAPSAPKKAAPAKKTPAKAPAKKTPAKAPTKKTSVKAPTKKTSVKGPKKTPVKAPAKKTRGAVKKVVGWVTEFIQKPTTTPAERAAAKASLEPKPKLKRDKRGRLRDYKKEYQRRIARGEVLQRATTETPSKAVSRGHPRRQKGEIGLGELRQLRHAVSLPSVGQQRRDGVKNPVQYEERVAARAFIAEIAGVPTEYVAPTKETIRSPEAERFAQIFVAMGLGSLNDAYTLYFSP